MSTLTTSPDLTSPHLTSRDLTSRDLTSRTDELAARLTGPVLLPGTDGYAAVATPWNLAVPSDQNVHLAAVEAADAADVVTAVRFAAAHGWQVTVRATGHGAHVAAGRDGSPTLLVLTHRLQELSVDPQTRTARVGAGVHWSQVIDAAAPYGLAGLAGSSPHVGVVGYLTGGGLGPVARTYGWAADLVTAFDVVTGDGELRRATATENRALFWGLRGGKGALGIVTAVETGLVELAELYGGCLYFAAADIPAVLRAWARWAPELPVEATTSAAIVRLPPLPTVPPPLAGQTSLAVRFAWVGDPADGERVLAPIAALATPVLGGVGPMPYTALGTIHADPVDPMPDTETATLLRELPAEAVETLLALAGPEAGGGQPCPQIIVELRLLGGRLAEPAAVPGALCHRDAAFTLLAIGLGVPPVVQAAEAHGAALLDAMRPWAHGVGPGTERGANLPNFAPTADPAELARKYDPDTFARLGTLAASYDPHRVMVAAEPFRG